MKFKVILILLFWTTQASSYVLKESWDYKFKKGLILKCENESLCIDFCGKEDACKISEGPCWNCIGTSVYLTHIFKNMGRIFFNSEVEIEEEEFFSFLKSGRFVSFSSRSIYNHISKFDEEEIQNKFNSLCNFSSRKGPIVFFDVQGNSRKLGHARYIICHYAEETMVYKMSSEGNVIVESFLFAPPN